MIPRVAKRYIKSKQDQLAVDAGCYVDPKAAQRVKDFIETFCILSKGRQFAGKPLQLLDWQWKDLIFPLFAWKRKDGTRRFRSCGVWIPKKNGKSSLMSAISFYMLFADSEPGAEVYHVAADRDQASIVFEETANMIEAIDDQKNPMFTVSRFTKKIDFPETRSTLKVLSSIAKSKHGFNSHCVIFDELAQQENPELWDVMRYSFASRLNPLLISISTSGYDRETLGFEQYRYAKAVKEEKIEDPYFLPLIYEADSKDDWKDPKTWKKANPSYGVTFRESDLEEALIEAQNEPRKENNFKTLRLNMWVGAIDAFIGKEWEQCAADFTLEDLTKDDVFLGIDLSRKFDLSAVVVVAPIDDCFYLYPLFFLPEDTIDKLSKRDDAPYRHWADEGYLILTPGYSIDYSVIRKHINDLYDVHKLRIEEIGFDGYNAEHLCVNELGWEDSFNVTEVKTTIAGVGRSTFDFKRLLLEGRIKHPNNPVLTWNAYNCVIKEEDEQERIILSKKRSKNKIDGIAAAVIGLNRALANIDLNPYSDGTGITTL